MNKMVKLVMIALFAAAGLVIGRVAILLDKTFSPATAARISTSNRVDYQDSNDFDHDGLDNGQEAVWGTDPYNPDTDGDGYLDGEEVASDHSPLIAGDDSLDTQRKFLAMNSTERLAQLIAGGVVSGDFKTKDPQVFASLVDSTANGTVFSILSALENVETLEDITNPVESSRENQEGYLKSFFEIISPDLINVIFSQPKEIPVLFAVSPNTESAEIYDEQQKEKIKTRFLQHAVKFQLAADVFRQLPVPENWTSVHQRAFALLKKLELYYRSIALAVDDPFRQMVVLGNLQNVYLEAQPILLEINSKIKAGNLASPDNQFFDVSLLLNL